MHVLFVTGEYPPQRGGVGAYTAELAQALHTQGVETTVLTSELAQGKAAPLEGNNIAVHRDVSHWGPSIWKKAATLADAIGAEWIHVQYQTAAYSMNPAINFAPSRWRRRRKVAWTYHDLLPAYLFPKAGSRVRDWVTRRPALHADAVIVTNEGDRVALADEVARLHYIPIGSNVGSVTLATDERTRLRSRYGYGSEQIVVGYFGFLNRSKGGLTLVRTLAALVRDGIDAYLLMIGERVGASDPTNAAYLANVEALIDALGLKPRVQWTGHLDDRAASAALNGLDVLLLPYEDGASLRRGTLMAGLANGCAIVTTMPQSPLPDLIEGRDLLYIAPGDPQAAAAAVQRLVGNPAFAGRLRAAARTASARFGWDAIARRHVELYRSLSSSQ